MEAAAARLTNPLRPPDAVYRLASDLVKSKRFASPRLYGSCVATVVGFLRTECSAAARLSSEPPSPEYQAIAMAFDLRHEHRDLSAAVEAMVLAQESPEIIAARLGVTLPTIAWYEAIFFDVRERLSAYRFIIDEVIEPTINRTPPHPLGYVWRMVGFLGGADTLSDLMARQNLTETNELVAGLRAAAMATAELQLHHASSRGQIDRAQLLQRSLGALREQAVKADGNALNSYERNVQEVLNSLQWIRPGGQPDPSVGKKLPPPRIREE